MEQTTKTTQWSFSSISLGSPLTAPSMTLIPHTHSLPGTQVQLCTLMSGKQTE